AEAVRLFRTLDAETQNIYKKVEDSAKKEPKPNELTVFAAASGKGGDVHFLIRGEVERKDGVAHPGFISVLERAADGDRHWLADASGKDAAPRVALARWLTDSHAGAGPLLARVIVNRLWQHHFGKGLVPPPDAFATARPPADAPRAARLPRRGADPQRLAPAADPPITDDQRRLPPGRRGERGGAAGRPGQPAVGPCAAAAPGGRGGARRPAGGQRH